MVTCLFLPGVLSAEGWQTNHLSGTGLPALPYTTTPILPQLKREKLVDLEAVPGSEEWVALDLPGNLWAAEEQSSEPRLVTRLTTEEGHFRAYNIVFAPNFPDDPRAWLAANHIVQKIGTSLIAQVPAFLDENQRLQIDWESRVELLRWTSRGHDGCDLQFSPTDGMLYASTGDGAAPGDPDNVGQTVSNHLGSILRIDVSDPSRPIRIPKDNPFLDISEMPPSIWAYGLRNPWRMSFHPTSGALFVGDNGDTSWELVRQVTCGTNHGWSTFEGSVPFRLSSPLGGPVQDLTVPVYQHPHTEMRSVIGGFFYQGTKLPDLQSQYIYGCYVTGKIWAFRWEKGTVSDVRRIAHAGAKLVSFSLDRDKEILILTHDGSIMRLSDHDEDPLPPRPIPSLLSETGLFTDTAALTPSPGVLPYEINAPPWQDGAEVIRHFG
ncbi:MAG: PQQ-dependent sugar dehydrogenase, partial [Verrucomicrobiota bacterium]